MPYNRRQFCKQSAILASGIALTPSYGFSRGTDRDTPEFDAFRGPSGIAHDPRLKELLHRGLDAAASNGASYAEARFTFTRSRLIRSGREVRDEEAIAVSVRAFADGYWGFASGPVWSRDELVRLGAEAAHQAKTNALGKPRVAYLAHRPVVQDGIWTMPIKIDPFSIHPSEIMDVLDGVGVYVARRAGDAGGNYSALFVSQDKAFGATDGSFYTQRVYRTAGVYEIGYRESMDRRGSGTIDLLSPAGMGWELFDEDALYLAADQVIEEIKRDLSLPSRPVDVGRYSVVFDAASVASILSGTIGAATELDRAMGYEANAGGTSYLNDPPAMIGSTRIGSPLLTVTANRSDTGAVATVQWDDEGVSPEAFPLVTQGVLTDFQTTREGSCWLTESCTGNDARTQSHGCAYAPSAMEVPLVHTANLVMTPGTEKNMETMIEGVKHGIAVCDINVNVDFQQLNGLGFSGKAYEVRNGVRIARLNNVGILFRAPELWKSLIATGAASSARRYGMQTVKGQPPQEGYHSVTAVPSLYENVTVVDVWRKA